MRPGSLPGWTATVPSLRCSASGCRLYGCELAMKMFGRTDDDLLPQVERVITATEFYEVTVGHHIVFI